MFDRKKYKQFAKMQLSKRWITPVIMTLICFAILFLLEARDFKEAFMELSEFTIPADEVLFTTETAETAVAKARIISFFIIGYLSFFN